MNKYGLLLQVLLVGKQCGKDGFVVYDNSCICYRFMEERIKYRGHQVANIIPTNKL